MLTRKKPLRSKTRLSRSGRLKPRNSKRKRRADARNFGEEAERVRAMPCLAARPCVWESTMRRDCADVFVGRTHCRGKVRAAHAVPRGMGGAKGDRFRIVPLCDGHHDEAGEARTSKRAAFEKLYGLDVEAEADRIAVEHPHPLGIRGLAWHWNNFRIDPSMFTGLDTYETEALLGWVRREMEREVERRHHARMWSVMGLDPWDREHLAHHIMKLLGWETLGLAWTLCELAGWPS